MSGASTPIDHLPAFGADEQWVNVVVETPKGSRGKFKFDPQLGIFMLHHVLPLGSCFPFAFGFVPSTQAADGDPLDVLLLSEVEVATGIVVKARLIGIIEAEQTEIDGKVVRNDRLVAVPVGTLEDDPIAEIEELGDRTLREFEAFFVNYDHLHGKEFRPLHRRGPGAAMEALRRSILPTG
jgi:inorganic pyrophosphatase